MSSVSTVLGPSAPTPTCSEVTFDEVSSLSVAALRANRCLETMSPQERIAWAIDTLPSVHILSSSFGAQAAVSLHLLTRQLPNIPVVLLDTGYLFPETYQFADALKQKLKLDLQVFRPRLSAAWQEARDGKRWLDGVDGLQAYNHENKIEPMQRALDELQAGTWFSGLRRAQSSGRQQRTFVERSGAVWKVHPIVDWTDREVYDYLKTHDLPYHPLWEKGYVSIGDVHTTRSIHQVDDPSQTRFFGLKRECGIHDIGNLNKEK